MRTGERAVEVEAHVLRVALDLVGRCERHLDARVGLSDGHLPRGDLDVLVDRLRVARVVEALDGARAQQLDHAVGAARERAAQRGRLEAPARDRDVERRGRIERRRAAVGRERPRDAQQSVVLRAFAQAELHAFGANVVVLDRDASRDPVRAHAAAVELELDELRRERALGLGRSRGDLAAQRAVDRARRLVLVKARGGFLRVLGEIALERAADRHRLQRQLDLARGTLDLDKALRGDESRAGAAFAILEDDALGRDRERGLAVLERELGRPGEALLLEPRAACVARRRGAFVEGDLEGEVLAVVRRRVDGALELHAAREPERLEELARGRERLARPARGDLVAVVRDRREERAVDRVVGVGDADERPHAAFGLAVHRLLPRDLDLSCDDELAACRGDRLDAAADDLDRLVEHADLAVLEAQRIREVPEHEARVAHAHIARDEHGLAEALGRVHADGEPAAAAERERSCRDAALEARAREPRGVRVGQAREFLPLRHQRASVGQEPCVAERARGARVEEQLERLARRRVERGEEPLVDRRVGAGDVEVDLRALRESVESARERDVRAFGAGRHHLVDHEVVVGVADRAADLVEVVGELAVRARRVRELEQSARADRRGLAVLARFAARDLGLDVERPLGDVEVGEDLGHRGRQLQRVRCARRGRRRAEVVDRERDRERRRARGGGEPGVARFPLERGQRVGRKLERERARERHGDHAAVAAIGAELARHVVEAHLVVVEPQRAVAQRHARRGLEVDLLAVGESGPLACERLAAERVDGDVGRDALEVELRGRLGARRVAELGVRDAAGDAEPRGPRAHRDRRDRELRAVDVEAVHVDRDGLLLAVEGAADRADREAPVGVGPAAQAEIELGAAVVLGREPALEAQVAELAVALAGDDAVLDDELVDRDLRWPRRRGLRVGLRLVRLEREQRELARRVGALGETQVESVGLDRVHAEVADEEAQQRELDLDAVGVQDLARLAVPAGRAHAEVLDHELVDAAEGDARGADFAADRARRAGEDDPRERRRPREVDERRHEPERQERTEDPPPLGASSMLCGREDHGGRIPSRGFYGNRSTFDGV